LGSDFKGKNLGIAVPVIFNSSRIYFNGKLISEKGIIDSSGNMLAAEDNSDIYKIDIDHLNFDGENILAIQAASFSALGGTVNSTFAGEYEICKRKYYRNQLWNSAVAAIFLFMGLYHLIIYYRVRREKSYLYFSLTVLSMSLYTVGLFRLDFLGNTQMPVYYTFVSISLSLTGIFFLLAVYHFFDYPITRLHTVLILVYSPIALFHMFSIFDDRLVYYRNIIVIYIASAADLLALCWAMGISVYALIQKKEQAFTLVLGLLLFVPMTFYDAIVKGYNVSYPTDWNFKAHSLVFNLMIAIAFSAKYSKLYERLIQMQKDYSSELEREVERKTEELSHANSVKDKLFSVISHDLRSPLDMLDSIINLVNTKTLSKKDLDRYIHQISEKLKYNRFLLENLLSWSATQLQREDMMLSLENVTAVVAEVTMNMETYAETKGIYLKMSAEPGCYALCSRTLLKVVLVNLTVNAVKFTAENGKVAVGCTLTDGRCTVFVEDTGVGISEQAVLDFRRKLALESSKGTKGETGSGIGLKICADLLSKMNSELKLESLDGKGSRFSFELLTEN
ncbi:MAG TPA: sensor histidine kinase, partial [Leptospiraceae bacterium]|nr:sensor histidine kinase [Leptospiraceae bacterium]